MQATASCSRHAAAPHSRSRWGTRQAACLTQQHPQPLQHAQRRRWLLRVNAAAGSNGAGAVAESAAAAAAPARHTSSSDEDGPPGSMTGVLTIKCPDAKGVVASVAQVGGC